MIVVVDTNVWVSALEFGGTPAQALTRALTVDRLAISGFIEAEVVRVLVEKFGRERRALQVTLNELLETALRVGIDGAIRGACRDPNDDAILETAVAANANLLVAGDRDLLSLRSFRSVEIVNPAAYVRHGLSRGGSLILPPPSPTM